MQARLRVSMARVDLPGSVPIPGCPCRLEDLLAEWAVVSPAGASYPGIVSGRPGRGLRSRIQRWCGALEDPSMASGILLSGIQGETLGLLSRAWRRGIAGETLDLLAAFVSETWVPGDGGAGMVEQWVLETWQAQVARLFQIVERHLDAADLRYLGFWAPLERLSAFLGLASCLRTRDCQAA